MTTSNDAFSKILESSKIYIDSKLKYFELVMIDKISGIMSNLIAATITFVFIFFVVFFLSVSLSFALSEWYGKMWFGFLVVAILYIVIIMAIHTLKVKVIRNTIQNQLLNSLTKDAEDTKN